jgi:hypothetical protein
MTALETEIAPQLDGLPGVGEPIDTPGMLDGRCDYARWPCAKPAGHKGNHMKDPADRSPKSGAAKRRSRSKATGVARPSSAGKTRRTGVTRKAPPSVMPGLLGMAWAAIGYRVEQQMPEPVGPPVGRVMQFQYIDAGNTLHRILLGLAVYRKIVAVAGSGGGMSDEVAALIGGPILAAVMATNEAAKMMLWPVFAEQIKASAVTIARAQAEQLEAMVTVSEYQEQVDDMLAGMQDGLFAPRPEAAEEAEPDA